METPDESCGDGTAFMCSAPTGCSYDAGKSVNSFSGGEESTWCSVAGGPTRGDGGISNTLLDLGGRGSMFPFPFQVPTCAKSGEEEQEEEEAREGGINVLNLGGTMETGLLNIFCLSSCSEEGVCVLSEFGRSEPLFSLKDAKAVLRILSVLL